MPHDITDRSITTLNKGKPTKQMINLHRRLFSYSSTTPSTLDRLEMLEHKPLSEYDPVMDALLFWR